MTGQELVELANQVTLFCHQNKIKEATGLIIETLTPDCPADVMGFLSLLHKYLENKQVYLELSSLLSHQPYYQDMVRAVRLWQHNIIYPQLKMNFVGPSEEKAKDLEIELDFDDDTEYITTHCLLAKESICIQFYPPLTDEQFEPCTNPWNWRWRQTHIKNGRIEQSYDCTSFEDELRAYIEYDLKGDCLSVAVRGE